MKKVEEDEGTEPSVAESRAVPEAGEPPDEDAAADDDAPFDEEADWRKVYADFIAMKMKFGEPTDKLTFDKFRGTLQRNKDALVSRHNCTSVKFRVYEQQGRAAHKASPIK